MQKRKVRSRGVRRRPALAEVLEPRWLFSGTGDGANGSGDPAAVPGAAYANLPAVIYTSGVVSVDVASGWVQDSIGRWVLPTAALAANAGAQVLIRDTTIDDTATLFVQPSNWSVGTVNAYGVGLIHGAAMWNDGQTTPLKLAIDGQNPDGTIKFNVVTSRPIPAGQSMTADLVIADPQHKFSGTVSFASNAMYGMDAMGGEAGPGLRTPVPLNDLKERGPSALPAAMLWKEEDRRQNIVLVLQTGVTDNTVSGSKGEVLKTEGAAKKQVLQQPPPARQAYTLGVGPLFVAKGVEMAGAGSAGRASVVSTEPEKQEPAAQAVPADPGTFEGEFSLLAAAQRPARQSEEELEDPYEAKGRAGAVRAVAQVPAREVEEGVQVASRASMLGLDEERVLESRRKGEPRGLDRERAQAALLEWRFLSRALAGLGVVAALKLLEPETRARWKRGFGVLVWRGIGTAGWEDVE